MADEPSKLDISDEMIAERRGGSGKMPDDMPLWMLNLLQVLINLVSGLVILFVGY